MRRYARYGGECTVAWDRMPIYWRGESRRSSAENRPGDRTGWRSRWKIETNISSFGEKNKKKGGGERVVPCGGIRVLFMYHAGSKIPYWRAAVFRVYAGDVCSRTYAYVRVQGHGNVNIRPQTADGRKRTHDVIMTSSSSGGLSLDLQS